MIVVDVPYSKMAKLTMKLAGFQARSYSQQVSTITVPAC